MEGKHRVTNIEVIKLPNPAAILVYSQTFSSLQNPLPYEGEQTQQLNQQGFICLGAF